MVEKQKLLSFEGKDVNKLKQMFGREICNEITNPERVHIEHENNLTETNIINSVSSCTCNELVTDVVGIKLDHTIAEWKVKSNTLYIKKINDGLSKLRIGHDEMRQKFVSFEYSNLNRYNTSNVNKRNQINNRNEICPNHQSTKSPANERIGNIIQLKESSSVNKVNQKAPDSNNDNESLSLMVMNNLNELSATSQNNYPSINKEAEVDAQLQEYRKKHQRIHKSTNHLVEDEDYQATSINIQTSASSDGDLSAIKISRFTQTVTSTENNRFRLKQDNPAKHLTPCPFLRKKGRCLKYSFCDFLHNEKYSHHSTDMRKKEVEYVPPTIRVEDEDYQATSINIQTAASSDEDLSAIKISRPTQTVTSTENNRFRQMQDNLAKHLTPCPFLRKKGRCLKGSSCDFLHDEKFSHHPSHTYKKEVEYVPPTTRNFHSAMERINQMEQRVRRIEDIGASPQQLLL